MNVEFRVLLHDLKTGQEAWHSNSVESEYADNQDFWWLDGNGACDCNRLSFLHDALQINTGNEDDYPCGHDRVAIIRVLRDGAEQSWAAKDDRQKNSEDRT